eukprot:530435_1
MSFLQSRLANHLDIRGDDSMKWSYICKQFWVKYYLLIGLIFVLILGSTVPTIGHKQGPLHTQITSGWVAVGMIFFVTGLGVKTSEIKKATLFCQLNIFVHFFIYIYHPCIGIALRSILKATTEISPYILDGLLITLCLPTTISSAVVLTVNSSGNEAAAVVNTTVANLLGIILTPGLILLFLGNHGNVDIGTVFYKLALRVILPFSIGQIIRKIGGNKAQNFIQKSKAILKKISETLLLFIIFCAISEAFYTGLAADYMDIIIVFVIILFIHVLTLMIVWYLSGIRGPPDTITETRKCCSKHNCLKFNIYDRIAILFCGSQKTAAFGIPIVSSLFESNQYLGIYLVPLLVYHPLQLIIDSLIVQPLALKVSRYEKDEDERSRMMDMNDNEPNEFQETQMSLVENETVTK